MKAKINIFCKGIKMNKFIKRTYYNFSLLFIFIYVIIAFLVYGFIKSGCSFVFSMIFGILLIVILAITAVFFDKAGVYVKNDELYDKFLYYKKLNICDIEAVKILKKRVNCKYYSGYLKKYIIKNKRIKSEFLYTIVFINKYEKKMDKYVDEILFMCEYSKNILCSCVYDRELIEFILNKKPDVRIIECDD